MRRLVILCMFVSGNFAQSAPITSTQGDCSPVATNGAKVEAHCTKVILPRSSVPSGSRALMVSETWLSPAPGFMSRLPDQHLDEQVVLTTVVRNLTSEPVIVNAVRLEILGRTHLRKKGMMGGEGVLQPTVGDTTPITILPAQTVQIQFGETLNLDGIIDAIEREDNLDNAFVQDSITPPRINGDEYIKRFSKLMESLYGKETQLRVTYFTGDYRTVAKITIPISDGTNFFYHGESVNRNTGRITYRPLLAYDAFLGKYLKDKEIWVPGFKIREAPVRCINIIPNSNIPGGLEYHDADCKQKRSEEVPRASIGQE